MSKSQLDEASRKIKSGEQPMLDDAKRSEIAATIPQLKMPSRLTVGMFLLLAASMVGILLGIVIVVLKWIFHR